MKKEKEIFVYVIFDDSISLRYEAYVYAGRLIEDSKLLNVWFKFPAKKRFAFNFPSVRQAKRFIREAFCDEDSPEYACIMVDGKMKGIWWTHTKKHIETITVSQFEHELFTNSGVSVNEISMGLWRD